MRRGYVDGVELIWSHALSVQVWPRGKYNCCAGAKLASIGEQGVVVASDATFMHHVEKPLILCLWVGVRIRCR